MENTNLDFFFALLPWNLCSTMPKRNFELWKQSKFTKEFKCLGTLCDDKGLEIAEYVKTEKPCKICERSKMKFCPQVKMDGDVIVARLCKSS